jgi:DNA-binding Lrp family transcriptional regulator
MDHLAGFRRESLLKKLGNVSEQNYIEKYKLKQSKCSGEIKLPTVFVFMNTEPESMPKVLKTVKAVEGVETAEMVYGVYDIVAKVKTEKMAQLKHVIAYKLRALAHVNATQTLLVV